MGNLVPTTFFSEDWGRRTPLLLLDFAGEVTGRIREMHIWFESASIGGTLLTARRAGSFVLNGTNESDPHRYLQVNLVGAFASRTGMDISITRGDPFEVRRISGSGILEGPAEFLLITEEGV